MPAKANDMIRSKDDVSHEKSANFKPIARNELSFRKNLEFPFDQIRYHQWSERVQPINNNRTLYLAVSELCRVQEKNSRSLEDYLSALLALIQPNRSRSEISVETFFQTLEAAFVEVPEPFQETWRTTSLSGYGEYDPTSFAGFERILIRQIADLREMDEIGTLRDPYKSFGVDAPSGIRWYNFMPTGYIECATEGVFGGWESGDDTGRIFVPGKVAFINEDGTLETANPEDLQDPVIEISEISWEKFSDFLECGRDYE